MITYQRAQLKVSEIFFEEGVRETSTDIVRYRSYSRPIIGSRCTNSYTLWLDLRAYPEYLLAKMSRTTRYEIRRAEREGFCYEFTSTPTTGWTEQFFDFFDAFAKSKHLKSLDRERLLALISENGLDLSHISSPDGRVLVWHAHLRCGRYVLLHSSGSLFRREVKRVAAYIGRANRLHHWLDMLRFRDEGFAIYDFGGWYSGKENQDLLRINRFKESFGGERVHRYDCDKSVTWKGSLALRLLAAADAVSCAFKACEQHPGHKALLPEVRCL